MEPLLVTIPEAARLLSLSRRSIENLIYTGRLARRKIGRRTLIPAAAVRAFAASDRPGPIAPAGTSAPAEGGQ